MTGSGHSHQVVFCLAESDRASCTTRCSQVATLWLCLPTLSWLCPQMAMTPTPCWASSTLPSSSAMPSSCSSGETQDTSGETRLRYALCRIFFRGSNCNHNYRPPLLNPLSRQRLSCPSPGGYQPAAPLERPRGLPLTRWRRVLASGYLAERMDLRYFLSLGMILSAVLVWALGAAYVWNIHTLGYFIAMQVSHVTIFSRRGCAASSLR